MSTTQSIIVYRSPYEQQFYESGMAFPVLAGCFAFFIAFVVASFIAEKLCNRYRVNTRKRHGSFTINQIAGFVGGGVAFALTIHNMII